MNKTLKKRIISIFLITQFTLLFYVIGAMATEDYVGVEENQVYEFNITIYDKDIYNEYIAEGNKYINFRIDNFTDDVEKFKIEIKEMEKEDNHVIDDFSTKGVKLSVVYSDADDDDSSNYENEVEDEIIVYDDDDISDSSLANLIFDKAWFIGKNVNTDEEGLEDAFNSLLADRASTWDKMNTRVRVQESDEFPDFLIISLRGVKFRSLPNTTSIRIDYHLDTGHMKFLRVEYAGEPLYSIHCDGPTTSFLEDFLEGAPSIPGYSLDFLLILCGLVIVGLVFVTNRKRIEY